MKPLGCFSLRRILMEERNFIWDVRYHGAMVMKLGAGPANVRRNRL